MSFINATHNQITLTQIRDILKLPSQASHADLVARVRELKAIEDLSLAVHQRAKSKATGCAACDRGDFQLGHADNCTKSRPAGKSDALAISYRRHVTGTRDHRIP
jgi:hypothetical protein